MISSCPLDNEGHREIMVQNDNDCSEQYLTELSRRLLRRGEEAWMAACRPPTF